MFFSGNGLSSESKNGSQWMFHFTLTWAPWREVCVLEAWSVFHELTMVGNPIGGNNCFLARRAADWLPVLCPSRGSVTQKESLALFTFTRHHNEKAWRAAFMMPSSVEFPPNARFCENHFSPSDVNTNKLRKRLKYTAQPKDVVSSCFWKNVKKKISCRECKEIWPWQR